MQHDVSKKPDPARTANQLSDLSGRFSETALQLVGSISKQGTDPRPDSDSRRGLAQ